MLPTLGGQTALNLAVELVDAGVLEKDGVELIGADATAIATAEDRERFKAAMQEIGLSVPASGTAHTIDEAMAVEEEYVLRNLELADAAEGLQAFLDKRPARFTGR